MGVVVAVVAVIALTNPRTSGDPVAAARTTTVAPGSATRTAATPSATAPTSPRASSGSSSPSGSGSAAPGTDGAALKRVPLVVLNNTTTSGLAAAAAQRFEQGGWTVATSGNYSNDIVSTCAYYDPDIADAEQAAEALQAQYPTIKRVRPRFAELPAGAVVVVLTPDYQAG